jgi:hypothetical protein
MSTVKRIGKYEIAEQIGVGGFGIVYKAWDPFIQRWVALKVCNASDREATQRFFREAQLAGALQHPNITLIFDFGMEGETPYFVQEFLTGTDLDELLATGKMTLDAMVAILLQVCTGLEFAHSRGIIHRDIKPANVRVMEDGTIKIMDFGIAKSLQAESTLTQTGVALGTAGYLAPEQLSGKPLDPRTDIFSLGVMAYEMVAGARPFAGPNLSNVIYQILHTEPVPPSRRNANCPENLEKAILKALAKEPADRFGSVREFAEALKQVFATLPRRGAGRRAETTTAMVREELSRLAGTATSPLTAATELAVRPLDHLPTDAGHPDRPRRRRWLAATLVGVVVVGLGAAAWWYLTQQTYGTSAARVAATVPTPAPTVAPPTPTPIPAPTVVPTPVKIAVGLFVDPPSEIDVDGKPLGKVQSTQLSLPPGKHTIRQRIAGYREKASEIEVTAATRQFTLRLPPFGILSVVNDLGVPVQGAKVFLDGTELGDLPMLERKVEAGKHELMVTWPDGGRMQEKIDISAGETVPRAVRPGS